MNIPLGNGPTLKESCPWLQDETERHERILTVVEHNSVIEGLPPFQTETRERIAQQLSAIALEQMPVPPESPVPSAGSSS